MTSESRITTFERRDINAFRPRSGCLVEFRAIVRRLVLEQTAAAHLVQRLVERRAELLQLVLAANAAHTRILAARDRLQVLLESVEWPGDAERHDHADAHRHRQEHTQRNREDAQ